MGGTFETAECGTFETDMPGTFHSATGGTFVPVMGGTFNPLLSYKTAKSFYERNDFIPLVKEERADRNTIPMYMDLKEFLS